MKTIKKSSKAYGLKSTFAYNDDVYMTSFGKGNDFVMEKLIYPNDNVEDLSDNPKFDVEVENKDITLKYKKSEINVNNPAKSGIKQDYLMLKDKLEAEYYGNTFNDNIHIQLAYNIMDIKKILTLYYYNIVYAINNLNRDESNNDFIGLFKYDISTSKNINSNKVLFDSYYSKAKNYLPYFGNAFIPDIKENDDKTKKYNYNVFRILSLFRQFIVHSDNQNDDLIFLVDKIIKSYPDLVRIIDDSFSKDVNNTRNSFSTNSVKNLIIISNILNIDLKNPVAKASIFKEYYNFAILKDQKNIGLNVAKLREAYYSLGLLYDIDNHRHDTYRNKINAIIDFIVYRYIHIENSSYENQIVDELRATMNDDEKSNVYIKYAKIIIGEITRKYNKFDDIINLVYREIRNRNNTINFKNEIKNISTITNYSYFTKFIYFITKFLDGKEINELLTSLINKFDNIQAFNDILLEKLQDKNESKFAIFNGKTPGIIANELRICKSLSRMKPDLSQIKKPLYVDVLKVLNIKDEELLKNDTFEFLDREKGDHKLRNFIVNNVIKSSRFMYVVKYMNPSKCMLFIKNDAIVRFVLDKLPDSQIDRYYKTITGKICNDRKQKVRDIFLLLRELDFNKIKCNERIMGRNNNVDLERLKALVGLYLTVIYLLTKSLVKTNSVYVIAFECFERDYRNVFNDKSTNSNQLFDHFELKLVKRYQELGRFNKHSSSYINTNIEEYLKLTNIVDYDKHLTGKAQNELTIFREYRNKVLHLNIISDAYKYVDGISNIKSYYDIYQYILQNGLFDLVKKSNDEWINYEEKFRRYKTYNNDLVKLINIPFAYNLPRYKNLTIADIFNDEFLKKDKDELQKDN